MGVSAEQGLDAAGAKRRLEESGPNVLARDSRGGIPRILWRQINDLLMYVLPGSGKLAVLLGKGADSIVVFAVVVLRDGSWTSISSGGNSGCSTWETRS